MNRPRIALLGLEAAATASDAGVPSYFADVNFYRALLRHPALAKPIADLVVFLWRQAALDDRLRELVIMRTAWLTDCGYEWSHHWTLAQRAGVTEQQLVAVRHWEAADCFCPEDRAALAATDETIAHGVIGEGTWGRLAEYLDNEQQLLELAATISTWRSVAELLRSLEVPLEESFPAWPPDGVGPRHSPP